MSPDASAFVARVRAITPGRATSTPSLPGHIAAWIADRIQFGDLKPGEAIREIALADQFDVSRGPVRDALRLLDRDGLVRLSGRKGASVRGFSVEETGAVFRIRAELFGAQCALAAATADRDPQAMAALDEGAALLTKLASAPNGPVGEYITVRRTLGWLIAAMSGNFYMAELSANMEREVAVLWISVLEPDRRKRSAAIWGDLCHAIAVARPGEAERLGRDLVLDGLKEIQRRSGAEAVAATSPRKTRRR
jgi:DNA-binding GntR family transcriptional regulator